MRRSLRSVAVFVALVALSVTLYAAASYPSATKSFSTHLAGQVIASADLNSIQDEIVAIENGLRTGLAHNVLPDANNTRDLGASGTKWATVYTTALNVNGATIQAPVIQTTTSTGTVNDFALTTGANVLRCNNATALTLTGFTAGTDGQSLIVVSIGAGQVNFSHQTGSTAANQLINFATVGSTSLAAGVGWAQYVYDATTARWRLVSHEQGAWIAFTPTLSGTTQTYTTQSGVYYLRGRMVSVNGYILLSAKGNAVGTITGLPFTSAAAPTFNAASIGQMNNLTTTWVSITGYVAASGTSLSLVGRTAASTAVAGVGNADLSNTTDMMFAVSYPVQ